jgi:hypothetical protein
VDGPAGRGRFRRSLRAHGTWMGLSRAGHQ